jgi:hypothetical protein
VSGRVWIALAACGLAVVGAILAYGALGAAFDRWDSAVVRQVALVRTGWLTTLLVGVTTVLASRWTIGILRLGTMAALVGLRRWRHLVIFLGCIVGVELAAAQLAIIQGRPRPLGVAIIGRWDGFSFPAPPGGRAGGHAGGDGLCAAAAGPAAVTREMGGGRRPAAAGAGPDVFGGRQSERPCGGGHPGVGAVA